MKNHEKDFITVTPDSGDGNETITVQADANASSERTSVVTISGGGLTRTVNIFQEGLSLTPVTFTLTTIPLSQGCAVKVVASQVVDTNIQITVQIPGYNGGQGTMNSGTSEVNIRVMFQTGITASANITAISPSQSSTQIYQY